MNNVTKKYIEQPARGEAQVGELRGKMRGEMRWRRAAFAAMLVLLALALSACTIRQGSGVAETETRSVAEFDQIEFCGAGELIITQGETESLTLTAEKNVLPHLRSEVRNNRLYVGWDNSRCRDAVRPTEPIRYELSLITLDELELRGSVDVSVDSLVAEGLRIKTSGSGRVVIADVQAETLSIDSSGSFAFDIAGETREQQLDASGTTPYEAADLKSQIAEIDISGSGEATVWATESLDVELSGNVKLSHYGDPEVKMKVSGSSQVTALGTRASASR